MRHLNESIKLNEANFKFDIDTPEGLLEFFQNGHNTNIRNWCNLMGPEGEDIRLLRGSMSEWDGSDPKGSDKRLVAALELLKEQIGMYHFDGSKYDKFEEFFADLHHGWGVKNIQNKLNTVKWIQSKAPQFYENLKKAINDKTFDNAKYVAVNRIAGIGDKWDFLWAKTPIGEKIIKCFTYSRR